MQVSPEHLQQLAQLLSDTVSPDTPTRKAAENNLNSAAQQQGFLLLLLETVRSDQASKVVRQAAGVYFKNVVKRQWEEPEEGEPVTEQDKNAIKGNLVPIMISLAKPETSQLQVLIGDALATIAGYDFPERWPTLVDELVGSLTAEDFVVNNGVLTTAHSIFRPWRSKFRTNELYSEINFVLERFPEPYYKLFQLVDQLLSSNQTLPPNASIPVLAQTLLLLTQLFYDLNSQDLAPFFEEHLSDFTGDPAAGKQGWLRKYLDWERPELKGDDDDEAPGPLQKIRASICEISELFAQKYSEEFTQLGAFVDGVWSMLSAAGPGVGQDVLVSKGLKFLSVVVKMGTRRQMFENPDTLRMFCEKIILPNMIIRQHEEEMFEDDPNEYIRRDLEPSIDSDTRRQAATEFTRSLLVQFDQQITSITNTYINGYLQEYAADPTGKWKSKDTAIYLLTSIASRGSTQQLGVTSTNMLVDVVAFFGQNVFTDLQAAPGSVHPILIVDAIKYLYTFRNQLTKEQLVSVLPLLVQHLSSDNYVIYSYAAITIERILFLKVNNQAQFTQADVQPFAENVLLALFANIEKGGTPEKIAENDYLMKCAMRVIITARQTLIPSHEAILNRLVKILGEISRNPSNPKFNQYCFESVSALIRFVCEGQPAALPTFEQAIFGPVEVILQQDIAEFIPYILQILAQLLELHAPTDLPSAYQQLMGPLAHASLWEQRGNVPALARIWKAIIMRGPAQIVSQGRIEPLLAIFQRLANSRINDVFGFDIITALYEFVPLHVASRPISHLLTVRATMQQYTQTIFMVLLTRQQTKPSVQFTTSFVYFALYLCAVDNAGPDFLISALDGIQPGLFGNVFSGVVLKNTQKTPSRNRKVVAVGLTKILSRSEKILEASNKDWWMPTFVALLDIFTLPQDVTYSEDVDSVGRIDSLDPEETGFQSSFSKLGASEATVYSPVTQIKDEKEFASKEISTRSAQKPGVLGPLIQEAQGAAPQAVNDFVKFMNDRGDRIA